VKLEVHIQGEKLDLFDDETVTLNQSVKDVADLTKVFNDFSNNFNVPASPNNNRIFKHYYNTDIEGGFDARIKVDGELLLSGATFRKGTFQLTGVSKEGGKPKSYKIRMFSLLTSLKSKFGEDKLSNLEYLDNYNHSYTDDFIEDGLEAGLDLNGAERAITYPLISYNRRFLFSTGSITGDDTQTNIQYESGQGIEWTELRPAIRVSEIIKSIENKYSVSFSNNFFNRIEFRRLYMSLPVDGVANRETVLNEFENVTTSTSPGIRTRVFFNLQTSSTDPYVLRIYYNDELKSQSINLVGNINSNVLLNDLPSATNGKIKVTVESLSEITFTSVFLQWRTFIIFNETFLFGNTFSGTNVTTQVAQVIIRDIIKDMTVFDFIDTTKKMFNLVIIPIDAENYYVNNLENWYASGKIIDVTDYIDTKNETVERGELYKGVNMRFESNDSILANEFRNRFKRQYGAIEEDILISEQKIDGKVLDIEIPFEKPIFERLTDIETGAISRIQVGLIADKDQSEINDKPFFFYSIRRPLGLSERILLNKFDSPAVLSTAQMPSNALDMASPSFSINFSDEINEYTGEAYGISLYSNFWKDYLADVMDEKRRKVTLKGRFPLWLLFDLKLNDRLVINGKRYVINTLKKNLNKRDVDLVLLTDIFEPPVNRLEVETKTYGTEEVSDTISILGEEKEWVVSASETWVNLSDTKADTNEPFTYTIEENTGNARAAEIEFTSGSEVLTLTIYQNGDFIIPE